MGKVYFIAYTESSGPDLLEKHYILYYRYIRKIASTLIQTLVIISKNLEFAIRAIARIFAIRAIARFSLTGESIRINQSIKNHFKFAHIRG